MTKRLIYISVSLITAALICVIAFQVAWYNNAHALKNELFERSVQDALKEVVTQIENREAADVITGNLEFFVTENEADIPPAPPRSPARKVPAPVETPVQATVPEMPEMPEVPVPPTPPAVPVNWVEAPPQVKESSRIMVRRCEPAIPDTSAQITTVSRSVTNVALIADRVVNNTALFYSGFTATKDSSCSYFMVDSMEWPAMRTFASSHVITEDIYPVLYNNGQALLNGYNARMYQYSAKPAKAAAKKAKQVAMALQPEKPVKKKLDEVLNKLVKEIEYKEYSPESRLSNDTLSRYIKQALNDQGIKEPFVFAVRTDPKTHTTIDSVKGKRFHVALYPNDISQQTTLLQVIIPGQDQRIFKSMFMHLAGSLMFTFIIICAFAYTIYVMMKQKKIAEIRNDFINNMTHEFKTPIATISLAADTISNQRTLSDSERVKHYTGVIKEENKRMNAQVEKVLQLALTDKNSFRLALSPCNLHELVMNALNKFGMIIESEQRNTILNLDAENDCVAADCFHLENAIANIIDNAIKYSSPGSPLTITTKNAGSAIQLAVADEGIGMKKEVQKRVFDKFYRAQQGNLHDVKGFGIGLSYAKNIIDAHKGSITLHSTPGKGTTFVITLQKKTV